MGVVRAKVTACSTDSARTLLAGGLGTKQDAFEAMTKCSRIFVSPDEAIYPHFAWCVWHSRTVSQVRMHCFSVPHMIPMQDGTAQEERTDTRRTAAAQIFVSRSRLPEKDQSWMGSSPAVGQRFFSLVEPDPCLHQPSANRLPRFGCRAGRYNTLVDALTQLSAQRRLGFDLTHGCSPDSDTISNLIRRRRYRRANFSRGDQQ